MTLINVTEAAKRAKTSRVRIYLAIERGELTPVADANLILLQSEQVAAFAAIPKQKGGRPRKQPAAPASDQA